MARRRLDTELVRRGLVPSRESAQHAIATGAVLVAGSPASKASTLVAPNEPVVVAGPRPRFVSRGGDKLAAALTEFTVDPAGRQAVDAGASTGGFTDCLLQRGAATVVAVDVGRGQLHERLLADPRVHLLDRTNVRNLTAAQLPGAMRADLVVADLSFISLRTVARALVGLTDPQRADLVVLVKPQFEAGRRVASRGRGVVSDPDVWRDTVTGVAAAFAAVGAPMVGCMPSPLLGAKGNVEFLVHLTTTGPAASGLTPARLPAGSLDLDAAVARARALRDAAQTRPPHGAH